MTKFKSVIIAPALAFLLTTSLNAEQFSITNLSLKQAIEEISKKSNMPYMVDGKLLEGKKAPNINNIEGVENALNEILKGSGLEATIENNTILISPTQGAIKVINGTYILDDVSVKSTFGSTTENTNSYTTGSMNTSTKLDLSIRETPQSVKVLTREYLDDTNITSYQELFDNITGVTTNRMDERIQPTARSFEVDYYLIDGIPSVMGLSERDPDLIIYDRVELVKGANGLMTGAGNPGLGINFIRKHANSKVFKGDINLSAGSWDNYSATLDVQTPLNSDGTIRARLVAKHQDSKSFLDHYEKQKDTFYGVVDMDLTDTTFLSLGASYEKLNRDWVKWVGLPAFYTDGTRTNFDRSTNISSDWTYWNSETTTIYAKATQYLYEDISLNINYLYKEYTPETALFFFGGKVDKQTSLGNGFFSLSSVESKSKENNIDIYASIPFKLGGLDHEIVTGFMYNKNELVKRKLGTPVLSSKNLYFNNINIPLATPIIRNRNGDLDETIQTGIYLAGKFSLMEDLKLITGVRVSDWEYKNKTTGAGNREFNNEITPYAGLVYDIDEHHSVYASYTDIFKTQTSKDINDQYLDPIVGKNYETGIKGEYFDKRLNTALSIFRVEQDGVATEDESGPNIVTGGTAFKAAKGVVSKGVEFDISGEITDNWNLSFGIANFEAKDAQDEKFETSSSRTTANLFTKYKINKDFAIGGGLNYKSKIYSGSGAKQITQDAYILANIMASYDVTKDLKLQLNINNLFDKKYYSGIGSNNMHYGEPRSFAVNMRYSF
ncbi:TonB-dependent siderophore receptor [Aliarcobacter lanthieri]|uniref:TonB-dependent siderophore receptor n=1 Tax=Aliarcobacter lanthieri TaxID=1355374 RepID=UPI00047D3A74|nr:TonB-dependent siderophore receptor [Aliarcobacter lanthieri]QKF59340.1 TonB-dependent ferric coprogen/ferric-rhodotorulic acid receptor [Aliarcobacter lanthieri]